MTIAGTLRRLGAATADPRADGELLTRFVRTRDERAFAELLRRHGPMVYGVCRRALGSGPDADDAFQVVFLVLVRAAAAVRPPGMVGNWLHGVTVRTARRARAMAVRRVLRERDAAARRPESADEPNVPDAETLTVLDAELAALPAVYRAVVLACDLNGRSRAAAAKELGWAEGTVATRLAKGRQLLADRLRRRGVTLAVGAVAATGVPRALAAHTLAAAGELMTTGAAGVAPAVLQLTNQVVSAMNRSKLNVFAVGLAAVVLMAGGLGVWRGESSAAPVPKAETDEGLIWLHDQAAKQLVGYSPDLTERKRVKLPAGERFFGLTPDGRNVVYANKSDGGTFHLRPLDGDGVPVDLGLEVTAKDVGPCWNPAGTQFVRRRILGDPNQTPVAYRFDLYDLASRKSVPLDHLDGHWLLGWADGDHLVSRVKEGDGYDSVCRTSLAGERTVLLAGDQFAAQHLAVAADGAAFVGGRRSAVRGGKKWHALWAMDLKSGELDELFRDDDQQQTTPACSPDGKRIAFTWECRQDRSDVDQFRLSVADRDGANRKTVTLLDAAKGDNTGGLSLLGWYPSRPDARRIKAPVPKAKDDGLIWTHNTKTNALTAYTPDGTEAKTVKLPEGVPFFGLTPDGTRMAFGGRNGKGSKDTDGLTLHIGDISETCQGEDSGLGCKPADRLVWSPDAQQVIRVRLEKPGAALARPGDKPSEYSHALYDLAGKKETAISLPVGHKLMGWSADGKVWRVMHANNGADPKLPHARWLTTPAGGTGELAPVCDAASFYQLAPDGPGFVGVGWKHGPNESPGEHKLFRVADGKETVLAQFEAGVVLANVCPAPDGRRVAVTKLETDADAGEFGATVVALFDADGKNESAVVRLAKDRQSTRMLGWFPTSPPPANPKAKPPVKEPIKAPVPKARAGDEQLLITSWGGKTPFLLVSPDGKSQEALPVPDGVEPRTVRVSPDGRWAVYGELVAKDGESVHGCHPCRVRLLDLHSPDAEPRTLLDEAYGESVSWAADGQAVFVSRYDPERIAAIRGQTAGLIPMTTTRVTLADGKGTPVPLPDGHRAVAVSPDGGTWLTHTTDAARHTIEAFVVTTKGGKVATTAAVGTTHLLTQLSADGERALCVLASLDPGQPHLAWADLATKKVNEVKPPDGVKTGWIGHARWSADGKRMAFAWSEEVRQRNGALVSAYRVTVCDADGGNPVTAVELEPGAMISGIDWLPAKPAAPKAKEPVAAPDAPLPGGRWR